MLMLAARSAVLLFGRRRMESETVGRVRCACWLRYVRAVSKSETLLPMMHWRQEVQ